MSFILETGFILFYSGFFLFSIDGNSGFGKYEIRTNENSLRTRETSYDLSMKAYFYISSFVYGFSAQY